MVGVQRAVLDERLAAIVGDVNLHAEDVDAGVVVRIDADLAEVHRPRIGVRHLAPRLAGIIGSIDAAFLLVLDAGVDDVRVGAIDVHADAAERTGRHALRQLGPRAAGIARLPHRAAGAAAVEAPGGAAPLIGRGVEHLVVRGIHHQLGGAGVVVDEVDARPGQAAVGRLVDAALAAASPQAAERRDVDHVVIDRIDDDPRDVLRRAEAHVLPGLAAVDRLVEAVAPRAALAVVVLAAADPHRVGVVRD